MMAKSQFLQAHPLLCSLFAIVGYALPAIASMLGDDNLIVVGNIPSSSKLVGRVLAPAAFHRIEGVVMVDGSVHVTSIRQRIEVPLPFFGVAALPDSRLPVSAPAVSRSGVIDRKTLVLTNWGMPVD